jgi:CDP-paratose synthetase
LRVAVLGSTGYLGRKLIPELIGDGHEIFCIHRADSDIGCFDGIKDKLHFCLSDYNSLRSLLSGEGEFEGSQPFDCLINASCSYMYNRTSEQITESNLVFPLRALNLAIEHPKNNGNLRYISLGTGLPDDFNIYTFAKAKLNSFGHFLGAEKREVHFINLELQNFYGPGEPDKRFIASSIAKMRRNEPVELTTGIQLRDFVYIDDVVDAIRLVMNHKELPRYLDVPIGSGVAPSIREIMTYIKEYLHSDSELRFGAIPLRINEPSIWADLSTYHMLGGQIRYTWKEGIAKVIDGGNK